MSLRKKDLIKVVFLSQKAKASVIDKLSEFSSVYVIDGGHVPIELLLRILSEDFCIKRLLVEGGGQLNGQFLKKDLIDEINLTISPVIFGGGGRKGIFDLRQIEPGFLKKFKLIKVKKDGDDLFLIYRPKKRK